MTELRYRAYISYSHRDEHWAAWLHHALENYRLPRKLVGIKTSRGDVPPRIRPVFRDRDDLSSATDLGETVKQALANSENMILLCSPDAADSHWVNEEVRQFARTQRQENIFCVVVDGEPGGEAGHNCFPAALAEIGMPEPLAADVRKWADGKHLSMLKLVAGMLGLPLDRLRRRDLQKRKRVWALTGLVSTLAVAVLITAITARISAQQRRVSGESLVKYKLNELRTMLNVTDDPENLSRLTQWDKKDLARLIGYAGVGEDALVKSALDLRKQGNGLYLSGQWPEAMEKFQQSWALLAESYRLKRSDQSIFFELGQAEFYIGQIYADQGELDKAEKAFTTYAEITRRLIVSQPENAEWVLEMAYALTNLGFLENMINAGNPERSLQLMQSALEYNQIALVLDPNNEAYQSELGQSHAFLADAQRGVCDLEGALQSRQKNVSLEREILSRDSDNIAKMQLLAFALSGLAVVQEELGREEVAIKSLDEALQLMESVARQTPGVRKITRFILRRKAKMARLMAYAGEKDSAREYLKALEPQWQTYFKNAPSDNFSASEEYAIWLLDRAWLARSEAQPVLAGKMLGEAMTGLAAVLHKLPGNRSMENLLMAAVFQYWELSQMLPPQAVLSLLPDYQASGGRLRACLDASMAVRQDIMTGNNVRAAKLTAKLLINGYHEAGFTRVCRAYALCSEKDR